jgi:hypothetical protein
MVPNRVKSTVCKKRDDNQQALSILFGEMMLLAVSVTVLATISAVILSSMGNFTPETNTQLEVTVDPDTNRIAVNHIGGDPVRLASVEIGVSINWGIVDYPTFTMVDAAGAPDSSGVWTVGKRLFMDLTVDVGQRLEITITDTNHSSVIASGAIVVTTDSIPSITQSPITLPTSPPPPPTVPTVTTIPTTTPPGWGECEFCTYIFGWVECGDEGQIVRIENPSCGSWWAYLQPGGIFIINQTFGNSELETFIIYLDEILFEIKDLVLRNCTIHSPPLNFIIIETC